MRQYEMMIILDPSLEERTVQPSLDQFLTVVTSAGGTVDKVDVWGRRRLAYEIDKKSEGIYTVIELNAEPDTVKELDRQLNLNEAVTPNQDPAARHPLTAVTAAEPDFTSSNLKPDPSEREYTPMAAGDTSITIIGNLVSDPELRYTPTGQAVATFRVASTPRFMDRTTNEWKDGDSLFLSCNVWRQAAENVAESLQRGMRVIVSGRLRQRSYETQGRREANRVRDRGRRGRPVAAERLRQGHQVHQVQRQRRRRLRRPAAAARAGGQGGYGGGAGGRASDDPWAADPAATTASPTSRRSS